MGGVELIQEAVERHGVLLAAHGPFTADGVSRVLELDVCCVSQDFSTFGGLVTALEEWLDPAVGLCKQTLAAACTDG